MIERIITRIENVLIVGALLSALVIGVAQVIMRYVMNYGVIWTEGALITLTVLGAMMGGSRAAALGMHIRIMLIVNMTGPKTKVVINIISLAITIAYCVFIIYASLLYVEFLRKTSAVSIGMGIELWIIYSVAPLTISFFLVRYLQRVKQTWRGTEQYHVEYID